MKFAKFSTLSLGIRTVLILAGIIGATVVLHGVGAVGDCIKTDCLRPDPPGLEAVAARVAALRKHAEMEAAIRAAKPGDLLVKTDGWVCALGDGHRVILDQAVVYQCIGSQSLSRVGIDNLASQAIRVVTVSDSDYGRVARCFITGRVVTVDGPPSARYSCGE